jgi:hypothetical protein
MAFKIRGNYQNFGGTEGNDFWVMKLNQASKTWFHNSRIPGHRMGADFDCSGLNYPAKFAVVGDFDGDGHSEIAIAPDAPGSMGNDFWVMKFDPTSKSWYHLSQIPGHPMEADFDCSGSNYPAKFAVVGDFDGDGHSEIAIAPYIGWIGNIIMPSAGNDFWVMKFDPASKTWFHLSKIPNHPIDADFDCSGLNYPAKFAVVGDFDGDGCCEIAIAPDAPGSKGNDFWVMKFDPASKTWFHLSQIPGHPMEADFDCSGLNYPAKFAVVGDFDADGRSEIAIAPNIGWIGNITMPSAANDFWVMKYDPASKTWFHLSQIPGHPMEADFDCSGLIYAPKFAVVGDFDGDKRSEIAVAPNAPGSKGNDFWVMKFDPASKTWFHLSQIPGHAMEADFDCSGLNNPAKFAVVGEFDRNGQQEILIAPVSARYSTGNDFWAMKFDRASKIWLHLSQIPNHPIEADIDFSTFRFVVKFAVTGDFDGDGYDEVAVVPASWIRDAIKEACDAVDTFITDSSLCSCIHDRCANSTVICEDCSDSTILGYNNKWWFFGWHKDDEIHLCINNIIANADLSGLGEIAVHEWAHSCCWDEGDGKGVPGDSGYYPD